MNSVTMVGKIVSGPELRATAKGTSVANMRIASTTMKDVVFIDVTAWGKTAEFCDQYFEKGKAIGVVGHLKTEEWESQGQKRSKIVLVAERVSFVGAKDDEPEQRAPQNSRAHEPSAAQDDIPF